MNIHTCWNCDSQQEYLGRFVPRCRNCGASGTGPAPARSISPVPKGPGANDTPIVHVQSEEKSTNPSNS